MNRSGITIGKLTKVNKAVAPPSSTSSGDSHTRLHNIFNVLDHSATDGTEKTTIHVNDRFQLVDTEVSPIKLKWTLWSTIKSVLKTYFDSLYAVLAHTHDYINSWDFNAVDASDSPIVGMTIEDGDQVKIKFGANMTATPLYEGYDLVGIEVDSEAGGADNWLDLTDTKDTTYTGKDLNVPVVFEANSATEKQVLTPTIELADIIAGVIPADGTYIINQNASAQTANFWISGSGKASTLESTVVTGTSPLTVASTTVVTNLNADLLDGQHSSYYQTALTGTAGYVPMWNAGGTGLVDSLISKYSASAIGIGANAYFYANNINTNSNSIDVSINGGTTSGVKLIGNGQTILQAYYTGAVEIPNGALTAATGKFTNLTDGYIPYHISDASGLGDSPIYTNGANVGIGTAAPVALLDVRGTQRLSNGTTHAAGYQSAVASDDTYITTSYYTDATTKYKDILTLQYTGNVGIGYTSGTEIDNNKLAVNGSGYFANAVSASGFLIGATA